MKMQSLLDNYDNLAEADTVPGALLYYVNLHDSTCLNIGIYMK